MGKLDKLKAALFAPQQGVSACDPLNELREHARKGSDEAKQMLALYAQEGPVRHLRPHACAGLAKSASEADAGFVAFFRKGVCDEALRYWSILGYVNSVGKAAYAELLSLAEDTSIPVAERAHAVKCLAAFSKQRFDRGLPSDPGAWNVADLRIAEVRAWATSGFPDGEGYSPPGRHPALDNPTTPFERIVSRFDKRLAMERQEQQDLADPTNWLAIAAPDDIERIKARWDLPSIYLDFLTRFSPINVLFESPRFWNCFELFGAAELIAAQDGYSFNPIEQQPIDDWPAHLVVIASHDGDPFVIDLSNSDGEGAPIETAEHGADDWTFHRIAGSFGEFLEQLAE